ncbi:OsmC family protein [Pseudonocardia sp. MH-G8]|uniref:OsmC family protein n=1 Tax=Pseudonocardia sp. MH-G8 TaxID=1854588 RepID=UPI000BA156F2|nr:OsmC family protein [Pseudonocardia sp. MH-G8]OZM78602.1 peroxiredoxin [Pseudonocardia sp. MH-G8]
MEKHGVDESGVAESGVTEKRDATNGPETLKERQAPLKARYREDPQAAVVTLTAEGELDGNGVACRVRTATALAEAGLHPATGGDGTQLCSGDMLLEALVACAGVTLRAVATSLGLSVAGSVHAEGDLDFRGTLGVDKQAPVGFRDIRLTFDLDTTASTEEIATLVKLTERYCVVLQTLVSSPTTSVAVRGTEAA